MAILSAGLAGVAGAVNMAPSAATPPSGLKNVVLASGTDVSHGGELTLRLGTDVVMSQITVDPGGSSGWHSHPGGALIIVKEGTLTVYAKKGGRCQVSTYRQGRRSSSDPGKWMTYSIWARSRTSSTSPSRGCRPVALREPTRQTRASVPVSDDLIPDIAGADARNLFVVRRPHGRGRRLTN